MPSVHVSRPVPEEALAPLREAARVTVGADRPASAEELAEGAKEADALVTMLTDRIDEPFLVRCPKLRVVANCAVGYDNLDTEAGERHGVWMANTPNVLTETTADLAFALLLAAARRIPEGDRLVHEGRFAGWGPMMLLGTDLHGKTIGVIGFGRIGQAVARRARGFEMRILFADADPRSAEAQGLGAERVPVDVLLAESDFVTVHVPLNSATRHLVDERALGLMKRGVILVNTSRGPVVDEAALARALESRHLGGAGIDVYEREPEVHPALMRAPNAVLVPHIGSATLRTRTAMAVASARNVLQVLGGHPPQNAVNRPRRPRA